MADTEPITAEAAASQRAAAQARRRKEIREAKIRAGGADRLNKITGLGGGIQRDAPSPPPPASDQNKESESSTRHPDPEEVTLSEHHYEPRQTARSSPRPSNPVDGPDQEVLRQLMNMTPPPGMRMGPGSVGAAPGSEQNPFSDLENIMMQMLGGGDVPGMGGMPGMGGSMPPGMSPMPGTQLPAQQPPTSTYAWRLVHALFALSLGLYVALVTPFSGTRAERDTAAAGDLPAEQTRNFFLIFGSVEALLLTTRFFIDGGKYMPQGILGTVLGFVPQPYRGQLLVMLRYGQIFMTVRADLLICVFALGVFSYLRSW